MAGTEWTSMGCNGQCSEFDCVKSLGQAKANTVFQDHWASWITESDLDLMKSFGLNSIRIPVGYWLKEDLVSDSEYFPQGGIEYLDRLVGWASDKGIYAIIDLHGAPGAQWQNQPSTGQVCGFGVLRLRKGFMLTLALVCANCWILPDFSISTRLPIPRLDHYPYTYK